MKPNYKNWVPKGMVIGAILAAVIATALLSVFGIVGLGVRGTVRMVLSIVLSIVFIGCAAFAAWAVVAYNAFSYNGRRQLSRQIVEGTAEYVKLPNGGRGLDVGCGSGALTIVCAKRNPKAQMVGIDRWGAEYASFSKTLCEQNARAEGAKNTSFQKGDAVKLDFPDESFDAVTSNYVYHNITGVNKQQLLNETLRVLKKGGSFAIHDLMSPKRYGDMQAFADGLRRQGYKKVELIDTTDGKFMTKGEARRLMLGGSTLLVGIK